MTDALQIVEHDNLSEVLTQLTAFGKPSLFFLPGWYCKVEMNTTASGVSFEVASGFGMPNPLSAAALCLSRAKEAVRKEKPSEAEQLGNNLWSGLYGN